MTFEMFGIHLSLNLKILLPLYCTLTMCTNVLIDVFLKRVFRIVSEMKNEMSVLVVMATLIVSAAGEIS